MTCSCACIARPEQRYTVHFCALHEAAPMLLEAAKLAQTAFVGKMEYKADRSAAIGDAVNAVNKAITAAEAI